MSPEEFKSWLEGFLAACPEQPTLWQCQKIREQIGKVVKQPEYLKYVTYPQWFQYPQITFTSTGTTKLDPVQPTEGWIGDTTTVGTPLYGALQIPEDNQSIFGGITFGGGYAFNTDTTS